MANNEKRAAIYCRTACKNEHSIIAIEAQRETLQHLAQKCGCSVVGVYTDIGYSGNSLNRPGLVSLSADTNAGKIDIILAQRIDRVARDILLAYGWLDNLQQLGIEFIAADGTHDLTLAPIINTIKKRVS